MYGIDWNATGAMLGGLGSIATAAIAVSAATFALRQVRETNRVSAEDRYLEYHWHAFENPRLARPDYAIIKEDPDLSERYFWFVVGMLMCVERILTTFPKDASWRCALIDDLTRHRDIIGSKGFEGVLESFYPPMREFVAESLSTISAGKT